MLFILICSVYTHATVSPFLLCVTELSNLSTYTTSQCFHMVTPPTFYYSLNNLFGSVIDVLSYQVDGEKQLIDAAGSPSHRLLITHRNSTSLAY